jgi:hypothetical protein
MDVNEVMSNFKGENGMPIGIDTAIKALRPNCRYEVTVAGGNIIYHKWWDENDLPPPTKEEVDAEYAYQEKMAKYYQYAYDRCTEYPDGFEHLDMLWHAINNGIELKDSEWFQKIKQVKEKYPKSEGEPPTKE